LTGSADKSAKLWDATNGKMIHSWDFDSGVRTVGWAHGERMILCAQDQTFSSTPSIFIYNIAGDGEEQSSEPVRVMKQKYRVNTALWGNLNETIVHSGEDGSISIQDVETGAILNSAHEHKKEIKDMQFSV
jgi:translation initiation factor 3 subunit I